MPKKAVAGNVTVGRVRVRLRGDVWELAWTDGERRVRRAGPHDRGDAVALAALVDRALTARRAGLGGKPPEEVVAEAMGRPVVNPDREMHELTVREAMRRAIQTGSQARDKRVMVLDAGLFMMWLAADGGAEYWREVRPSHVAAYLASLPEGMSQWRKLARMKVLRLVARYWAREAPEVFRDVTAGVRVPLGRAQKAPVALSGNQARELLGALEVRRPVLAAVYALAIGAGLRILEAASIRLADVDFGKCLVTVADVPWHVVKTAASRRTVPVAPYCLAVVRRYVEGLRVTPAPGAALFLTADGAVWRVGSLALAWARVRALVRERGIPDGFTPSECRATFATLARRGGVDSAVIDRALGHAGTSVRARHYDQVCLDELRQADMAVDRVISATNMAQAEGDSSGA